MCDQRKLILVFGMHRSGTSVATRSLRCLGVSLGESHIDENATNPKGFFEDAAIVRINERLLREAGGSWNSPSLSTERLRELAEAKFGRMALHVIISRMKLNSCLAIKDPRLCLLLDFWRPIVERTQARICCLLVIRNPASVAQSLAKNYNVDSSTAEALWQRYIVSAMGGIHSTWTTSIVEYEGLLAAPYTELQKVGRAFDLKLDISEFDVFCRAFLDASLNHATVPINGSVDALTARTYDIVTRIAKEASLDRSGERLRRC